MATPRSLNNLSATMAMAGVCICTGRSLRRGPTKTSVASETGCAGSLGGAGIGVQESSLENAGGIGDQAPLLGSPPIANAAGMGDQAPLLGSPANDAVREEPPIEGAAGTGEQSRLLGSPAIDAARPDPPIEGAAGVAANGICRDCHTATGRATSRGEYMTSGESSLEAAEGVTATRGCCTTSGRATCRGEYEISATPSRKVCRGEYVCRGEAKRGVVATCGWRTPAVALTVCLGENVTGTSIEGKPRPCGINACGSVRANSGSSGRSASVACIRASSAT